MRRLLFIAAVAIAPLAACSKKSEKAESSQLEENLPEISIDDVEKGLADKTLTIYDCNNDHTRKKHGVIAGATLVDDPESYPASILPADKSAKLVFYCGGPG
jgi:hypothetical protein